MLTELSVENFALVERLRLRFGQGLNLLTGETGAGKSILLDALGMVLGERTGVDVIRHGAEKARVEAVFTVSGDDGVVRDALEAAGVEAEDGLLLLSRELSSAGKSVARINGRPATVSMLKAIGDSLVDVHGQHASHQSLLMVDQHAGILDSWCGSQTQELIAAVGTRFAEMQTATRDLAALRQDARERVRAIDLLSFQRDEIDTATLLPGEDEELQAERLRLGNSERLHAAAVGAYAALKGAGGERAAAGGSGRGGRAGLSSGIGLATTGAVEAIATAVGEIEHAAKIDERLAPLLEALQSVLYSAEDAVQEVRTYRDEIEFNPERLEEIENRLDILKTLKRKYGDSVEEILRYREEIAGRLEGLEHAEERIAGLENQVAKAKTNLEKASAKLTAARKKAAGPFADAIMKELADLAMTATKFSVAIEQRPEPTATGADAVEFLISPNPGEPLKPLAKIASGGELSRVMLAMKSALSRMLSVTTLVFDEIDAGIGGRTGTILADKLHSLSRSSQILCITHLPQIAARGDLHLFIEKRTEKGRTTIHVAPLDPEQRVHEIARMLGGARVSETVLQHAREMLGAA